MTSSDTRPPAASGSAHGRRRRALILTQAAALFADKGFHAVGMGDIGAAAGVTGPAIYRHFANKPAILVGLFDQVTEQLLEGARVIVDTGTDTAPDLAADRDAGARGDTMAPAKARESTVAADAEPPGRSGPLGTNTATREAAALERLVAAHVGFALAERSLIKVYAQEAHNLPDPARSRLRRVQRLYAEEFVHVVADLRPELTDARARVLVHAAFGLMNSVADHDPGIPPEDTAALLRAAAVDVLLGPTR